MSSEATRVYNVMLQVKPHSVENISYVIAALFPQMEVEQQSDLVWEVLFKLKELENSSENYIHKYP